MASLKRKMAEQTRVVKLKDQSDKQVSRLNTEIVVRLQQMSLLLGLGNLSVCAARRSLY